MGRTAPSLILSPGNDNVGSQYMDSIWYKKPSMANTLNDDNRSALVTWQGSEELYQRLSMLRMKSAKESPGNFVFPFVISIKGT